MGWTGQYFTTIIIEGTNGGLFLYNGAPAFGNLVFALSVFGGTDQFGNTYGGILQLGENGQSQIVLELTTDNGGALVIKIPGYTNGQLVAGEGSDYAFILLSGPAKTASGTFSDHVEMDLFSSDGVASSANGELNYFSDNGTEYEYAQWGFAGMSLNAVELENAVLPGTGTAASPAQAEGWHTITLDSSWTSVKGPYYRLTPWNTVQVMGSATHAAFTTGTNVNGSGALPAAYRPASTWNIGGNPGIPGRAGAEITSSGVIVAEPGSSSCTEVDFGGEYPLNL